MHSLKKFRDLAEMENYFNGGLIGANIKDGVRGLVGKKIKFITPSAATVTFTAGSGDDPDVLYFTDIKTQIEAAVANLLVYSIGGYISFLHSATPAIIPVSIDLTAATATANTFLGFPSSTTGSISGRIVKDTSSGTGPRFVWWNTTNDGAHAVLIYEDGRASSWTPATTAAPADSGIISAVPATVFKILAVNSSGVDVWLQLFDRATVPADGAVPRLPSVAVPGTGEPVSMELGGMPFTTGVVWASSSTVPDKHVTAISALQVSMEVL